MLCTSGVREKVPCGLRWLNGVFEDKEGTEMAGLTAMTGSAVNNVTALGVDGVRAEHARERLAQMRQEGARNAGGRAPLKSRAVEAEPGERELAAAGRWLCAAGPMLGLLACVFGVVLGVASKLESLGKAYGVPEQSQAALVGRALGYFAGGRVCLDAVEVKALRAQFGPLVGQVLSEEAVAAETAAGRVLGAGEASASCALLKKNWGLVTRKGG